MVETRDDEDDEDADEPNVMVQVRSVRLLRFKQRKYEGLQQTDPRTYAYIARRG